MSRTLEVYLGIPFILFGRPALVMWLAPLVSRALDVDFSPTYWQAFALLLTVRMVLPGEGTYLRQIRDALEDRNAPRGPRGSVDS